MERTCAAFAEALGSGEEEHAVPVAAIQVLLGVIERSSALTMHGLDEELRLARAYMIAYSEGAPTELGGRTSISVVSGCDLFLRHVTRTYLEFADFEECKKEILRRGQSFAKLSRSSRDRIADLGHPFISDESVVLVHGHSRVVITLLQRAARCKRISVIATRADGAGNFIAKELKQLGVPVKIIADLAIGFFIETASLLLLGAEGVVETGGVVNKIGTLPTAIMAKAAKLPVYVAAESYKFARFFPLRQSDLIAAGRQEYAHNRTLLQQHDHLLKDKDQDGGIKKDPTNEFENQNYTDPFSSDFPHHPPVDYTPPEYIDLLFTDIGVLTPAAVSDELIRLYQ
uniref:Translation initiation factor eIF2B subunit alpha n=1 Tax=Aureoumbra lagunensis TaxID=44058 RepID=A0A7S3JRX8_9STRA|eukprot:CAMPEP_0197343376 /NCGR_PEP_ID=MMETSP0893-20130614/591_1 /TAXON_ID=44058 ORGANISM="Aureoumbra lagunensis, Strain CCMP1510" /NCGR_SAMPLE_ID=MMETSP0893 /ASSEMBLY_ACC=CAM_ASM_000539 /LENGTH=342 /DNA_ID=CAMNT_0042849061 /DNA_START=1 /DNA_END=1032 /DNA_ORIENTATION=-